MNQYNELDIVLPVELHPHAYEDLRRIKAHSPEAAGRLAAIIQEMKANSDLHDILVAHGAVEEDLDVKHWWARFKKGDNLWRLKPLRPNHAVIADYRIIYAFIPHGNLNARYCVLAVVHRGEFNYEPDSAIGNRILQDYNSLD